MPHPRPIDADWHMPVQTCSFLYRREIWERCPYLAEYLVVGDHVWFRLQMRLGLKLVSVRKPIGIFTWHEDDIAKRIGPHQENALADVNRKTAQMRIAKLFFRLRKLVLGGCLPPLRLSYEIMTDQKTRARRSIHLPRLGL